MGRKQPRRPTIMNNQDYESVYQVGWGSDSDLADFDRDHAMFMQGQFIMDRYGLYRRANTMAQQK